MIGCVWLKAGARGHYLHEPQVRRNHRKNTRIVAGKPERALPHNADAGRSALPSLPAAEPRGRARAAGTPNETSRLDGRLAGD